MTLPHRLSFSAQLTNCNVGPCWHVMAHIGACWHSAFSTFHSLGHMFSCSMKFFHSKIALGLALLESWGVACETTEKHWCPVSTFAYFRGTAFHGKPAKITFVENKDAVRKRLWICLSVHGRQTAMLPPVGTLNSARSASSTFHSTLIWAIGSVVRSSSFIRKESLGWPCANLGVACATTEKHWCPVSTFAYFRGTAFLGKPAKITFVENKDVNSWIKFRL